MADDIDEIDDDADDVVPAAFAVTVPRREEQGLSSFTFEALKGQGVRVRANGFDYRGILEGADDSELYLRGELRYFVLPLSTVTDVRADDALRREPTLPSSPTPTSVPDDD